MSELERAILDGLIRVQQANVEEFERQRQAGTLRIYHVPNIGPYGEGNPAMCQRCGVAMTPGLPIGAKYGWGTPWQPETDCPRGR